MKRSLAYFWPVAGLIAGIVLIVTGLGQAAQVQTLSATVAADSMTWSWDKDLYEFTGNCRLAITSPEQATLIAPRITLKLTKGAGGQRAIETLKTTGQTELDMTTKPDSNGIRRHMHGTATGGANYSDANQSVELIGGARIDSISLPESPESERVTFTAEALTVDLANRTVAASKGQMKVDTALPEQ